jgi:mono/diheme cytochrome c family protein
MMRRKYQLVLVLALFLLGASSFVQSFDLTKSIARGKEAYSANCQNCHMEDGKGLPGAFPPLAKSSYLSKPAGELIGYVLKGQTGEITVNGTVYNAVMPAQDYLSDEQIADIYNYVRNSWGNKSTVAITPAMVSKKRTELSK